MAHDNASTSPAANTERHRIATAQFERANQVVATGNYDYGIRLLLSCCQLDPANLIYRQALRRTEKAKYRNNLRGGWFCRLTTWPARMRLRAALQRRDYLRVLEQGERILTRNPWDVPAQRAMAGAAETLGQLDLAIWILEQARQKQALDASLNRALARLYEKRGSFTQAIALWELVYRARPLDAEAKQKIKDLSADDTIIRGQYDAVLRGDSATEETAPDQQARAGAEGAAEATEEIRTASALSDRLAREAAPLHKRLEADPTNTDLYMQLATLYRRGNDLEQARAVLNQGLGATGKAFALAVELADLEIEPIRRNLAVAEERLRLQPDDAELRALRGRLRREIAARELELFRQKADRYPTDMAFRFEVGVRLLHLGQTDEAIKELQASRADPRYRWQSLLWLGHCFKTRNSWRLAQRNFEEALRYVPATDTQSRKDILFELATGHAEARDLARAVDVATELANIDFTYRDVGRLLDEWQAKLQQARAVH
jgi:tetratricopeptide (TPR) repeat protein